MENLVVKTSLGNVVKGSGYTIRGDVNSVNRVIDEYAAYAASGLTPDEVAEYAAAKAEGRVVALPCKVGVDIYAILGGQIKTCVCVGWKRKGGGIYMICMDRETGFEYSLWDFTLQGK